MRSEPYLRGARVLLRRPAAADIPAIIAWYDENQSHLRATDPERPEEFYTERFWHQKLRETEDNYRNDRQLQLLVLSLEDQRLLGIVNFSNIVRGMFQACHLGYAIGAVDQGKGLMHEAVKLAIGYAFDDMSLHRIMANYLPENRRSAQLLARLGFVAEGYARDYLRINGRWRDHVLTSLINERWAPAP